MDSKLYEPVSLGRMPSLEIEMALANGDIDRMWKLADSGLHPKDFFDTIKTLVFNISTQSRKGRSVVANQNTTMFMWPVLYTTGASDALKNAVSNDKGTSFLDTVNSLSKWMSYQVEVGMVKTPLDYSLIASLCPVEIRQLLHAVTWRQEAVLTAGEGCRLPSDAPQLAFYVGAMTKRNSWPSLPDTSVFSTLDVSTRLCSTLRYLLCSKEESVARSIAVGVPEVADDALTSGLRMWLTALHEKFQFGQWDAQQHGHDQVDLWIELQNCEETNICIPLRSYQIGIAGIEQLISQVANGSRCNGNVGRLVH